MDSMIFVRIAQALNPLQSVCVEFSKGIDGVRMLSVLNSLGVVEEKWLADAVIVSQDWGRTSRIMKVRLSSELANIHGLPRLAERGIESIHSSRESPLNALQTRREKKREEAYLEIVNAVATKELLAEIRGYGLDLQVEGLKDLNFFNFIKFSIKNENEIEEILSLDGWSGNIRNGHGRSIFFCADLKVARLQLKHEFNLYIDRVTAAA